MTSESAEALTTTDRSWSSRDAAFLAGLFAVSLALRIAVVFAFSVQPTWDGAFYHRGALSIAEGYGYSEPATIAGHPGRLPWSHYPVGYSALLGAAYKLFGSGLHVAPLVNALVGALTVVVVYLFGLELLSRRRARIAGALLAFHPGMVLYCSLVMTEPLAGFLVLLTGYLAWKLGRYRWGAVLCGAVVALSAFVRPQSLLAAPLLLLLIRGTWLRRLTQLALAGALADLDQVDKFFQPRAWDVLTQRRALAQPHALALDAAKRPAAGRRKRIRTLAVRFLHIAGRENLIVEHH